MNERLLYSSLRIVVSLVGAVFCAVGLYIVGLSLGLFPPIQVGFDQVSPSQTAQVELPARATNQGTATTDPLWQGEPDLNERNGEQRLESRRANPAEVVAPGATSIATIRPLSFRLDLSNQPLPRGLIWTVAGAALAFMGLALIVLAFRRVEGSGQTVVLQGLNGVSGLGGGKVTVSMRSLHAMAETLAERVPGVREASTTIKLKQAGWHIGINVAHGPEDSLPDIAVDLRQKLTSAFEHQTGLPVARIDIAGRLGLQDARRRVS